VTKLFGMTMADRAYFGQKDWQQLQVVQKMVRDLNIPVHVVGCETVREADGLAMSSRNARLSPENRLKAGALYAAMMQAAGDIRAGAVPETALAQASAAVLAAGFDSVEYIALRDSASLLEVGDPSLPQRMLAAAWLGDVRLIDNIAV
jgi:pantoate--beta-alanine ligase